MNPPSEPGTPPAPALEPQRRPGILYYPDGTPLHWSEAAKYPYGLYPGLTAASAAPPVAEPVIEPAEIVAAPEAEPFEPPVEPAPEPAPEPASEPEPQPETQPEPQVETEPEAQAPPVMRPKVDRVPWSAGVKMLVLIAVLALGGVVVPFSVMNWESLEWHSWFGGSPAGTTSTTADTVDDESSSNEGTGEESETEEPAANDESSLVPVSTAEVEGGQTLVSYLIADVGLTVTVPEGWDPVSPNLLADCDADSTCLAGLVEKEGPTVSGAFLNTITIRSLDVPLGESLTPKLVDATVRRFVDEGPDAYDYFQLLTPTRTTTVGAMYSRMATARITWNDRVLVKSVYAFTGGGHLFQVELQTDDADWDDQQDIFQGVLDSFAFTTESVTLR